LVWPAKAGVACAARGETVTTAPAISIAAATPAAPNAILVGIEMREPS
jgi:hypothetical protein